MTDLLSTLPEFPTHSYSHLIPSLEKHGITVADLLASEPIEIVKRCPLPLLDVRRLVSHIIQALQEDIGISVEPLSTSGELFAQDHQLSIDKPVGSFKKVRRRWDTISTLDKSLDDALGGGIPTGYVAEVTGESGVGKTQFVLTLLLAAQLPPPDGLARSTIYISTEAQLSTLRLQQILSSHSQLSALPTSTKPSLANVRAIPVQDLEVQEHILEYQLPTAIRRFNAGLVVLDSVAANYRAEHGSMAPKDLAARALQLAKLGKVLRRLAKAENVAVVVANQVSDRFEPVAEKIWQELRSSSPAMSSSPSTPASQNTANGTKTADLAREEVMSLDHQQRFFTGWGADLDARMDDLKTPALGLGWTNQIAARIVLKIEGSQAAETASTTSEQYVGGKIWKDGRKKRFLSLVFAPWARCKYQPVEFEIRKEGVVSTGRTKRDDSSTKSPRISRSASSSI